MTVCAYTEDDEMVIVSLDDGAWYAFCTCSWRSEPLATRRDAESVADDHAALHATSPNL